MRAFPFRRALALGLSAFALGASLFVAGLSLASAQDLPPDALRLLQQHQNGTDQGDNPNSVTPRVTTYPAITIPTDQAPPSHLEGVYSTRAGAELQQFGYDALGVPTALSIAQSGAVPDGYTLGFDDELIITLRGQENSAYRVRVDRDGSVTLPKLSPIPAAGRSFGAFRADLERQVGQAYLSTKVFVTLGNLHQLSILVAGEVRVPGVRIVSALASPLDAILLSGGIKKSGSLRSVRVVNGNSSRIVDLYAVVAQGSSNSLGGLRDGDRIYVPPLGPTVAISGAVSRPGIYELPAGRPAIVASALLRLSGGTEIASTYNLAKLSLRTDGAMSLSPTSLNDLVRNGEVLIVTRSGVGAIGRVVVMGDIPNQGLRPLSVNTSIGNLFHSARELGYDAYAPFLVIRRRDPITNAMTLIPASITSAFRGAHDVALQSDDVVYVLTRKEAEALANLTTRDLNSAYSPEQTSSDNTPEPANPLPANPSPGATPAANQIDPATGQLIAMPELNGRTTTTPKPNNPAGTTPDLRLRVPGQNENPETAAIAQAQAAIDRNTRSTAPLLAPERTDKQVIAAAASLLGVSTDSLLRLASDNMIWILDEVRQPGPYLAAPGTSIADMIAVAGGAQQSADLSEIEVTSTLVDQQGGNARTSRSTYSEQEGHLSLVSIRPQDVIRLRPVYTDRDEGTVTITGQVRYPGVFDITRDERLSSILQRAGGPTEVAYPYGAIFTRKSAALVEKEGNDRSARELELEIPALVAYQSQQNTGPNSAGTYLTQLVQTLRSLPVLGRITITADPTVLATKPELDLVLEPGDTIYIPKRPSTVTVSGEVLHTGSFQYRAGLRYSDYVRMAGGATQSADEGRTFIVLPDGSSQSIDSDWLAFGNYGGGGNIPPGTTIVVPRDIRPFSWSQFFKDSTQILSQLAVTAASLSILSKN